MNFRRAMTTAALSVVLVAAPAAVAHAEAPTPLMPMTGINSLLVETPDNPPEQVGPGVSYFEVYGPAGQFVTPPAGGLTGVVDSITGGAVTTGQEAASGQTFANWIMLGPEWGTAATSSLASAVYNTGGWLALLDPAWDTIGGALNDTITTPFAPLVAVILLLILGFAVARGRLSKFAGTFGVALAAAALMTLGGQYPAQAGAAADDVIVETTATIRSGINGTTTEDPGAALIGGLSDRILVDSWCVGMLGSKDSPTAVRYCPDLYDATHFTWAEAARAENDKDVMADLVEAKAAKWDDTAKAVQEANPDAYAHLIGERGASRVGVAATAAVSWAAAVPMILVALVLVVAAFFIIRVVIIFLPVLGLVMVIPRFHRLLPSLATTVGAAILNSIAFSAIASVVALVATSLMSSDLPFGVRLVLTAAFTVVAWVTTKPFRKLTRMATNWDPGAEFNALGNKLTGALKSVATTAVGAAAGIKLSGADGAPAADDSDTAGDREPRLYRRHFTRPDIYREPAELPAGSVGHVWDPAPIEGTVISVGDVTGGRYRTPTATMERAPQLLAITDGRTTDKPQEDTVKDEIHLTHRAAGKTFDDATDGDVYPVYDTEKGLVMYRNGRPVDEDN